MDLLVFAHRGEAQTFLKEMDFKSHPEFNELYINHEAAKALLLTDEGYENVFMSLTYAIGLLKSQGYKLETLTNLGICGAFEQELQKGQIHEIRSIYGQDEFKSFACLESSSRLDLITAKERVLDLNLANRLSSFAPLVDREAWAIGMVAKKFGLGLRVFKLISDHISDAPICEYIKEAAHEYSQELYRFYLENLNIKSLSNAKENYLEKLDQSLFYFTLSMEREISSLIEQNLVKYEMSFYELMELNDIKALLEKEIAPKKRALFLRDLLKEKLFPTRTRILKQLDAFVKEQGLEKGQLSYDPSLEKVFLNLKYKITSEQELKTLQRKITNLNWQKFTSLMNGEEL